MKVGDLVVCKPGRIIIPEQKNNLGIIIYEREYEGSGTWYCVQWPDDFLWHPSGDLELLSEHR